MFASFINNRSLASCFKIANFTAQFQTQLNQRLFHTAKPLSENYEGDGKTTVTILNTQSSHLLMVNSVSIGGFRLNNGFFAVGPIALFPRTVLQWNVGCVDHITAESLSLFAMLEPKLDILVIGTGEKKVELSADAITLLRSRKIYMEILPTDIACSTFNFLNSEGRCVAGAFIPPEKLKMTRESFELEMESTSYDPLVSVKESPIKYT